jgi:hypothetical protein
MTKQTYTTIAENLRTNESRVSNLVVLGGLVIGSNITKEGIRKLLRTYCKTDYDRVDEKVIIEDFYKKGQIVLPKRNVSKKDSGQVRGFKKPEKALL